MAIQCAYNKVVVKVKTKYIRNFTKIMKIAAIQNNTSIEPADCVNIVGEVISVPKKITTNKREYKGFSTSDIQPGDTAIFSHNVIFSFESTEAHEEPIFKNSLWYMGEEYFLADILDIFAVVRDNKIRMQNGYVMVENMEKKPAIILPAHVKKAITTASATVSHIRNNLPHLPRIDAERGDKVYFKPTVLQLYQINELPFGILRQSDILGKEVQDYAEVATLGLGK